MASTDRDALIALHRSLDGENWGKRNNWDTDAALSQWHGIEVNDRGRVVVLKLSSNNIGGTLAMVT